jgi:hypothetical protein
MQIAELEIAIAMAFSKRDCLAERGPTTRGLVMAGRKPPLTNAQRQKAWRERQREPNKRARRVAEKVYELLIQDPVQFAMAFDCIVTFLDMAMGWGPEDKQIRLPLDDD